MELKTLWTSVGLAKRVNAEVLGTLVEITHIAFGDAAGNDAFQPNQTMVALTHEVYRRPVDFVQVDDVNPAWVNVEGHILADDGGWWVREIGLFDADGDLVAVGNCAPRYKPLLAEGESADQYFRLILLTSNTAVIQPKINPAMALASRAYVDAQGAGWNASHVRVVAASGPVLSTDRVIVARCTVANIVLTLPSAAAKSAREVVVIKDDDTEFVVTLQAQAGQTLPTSEGRQQTADLSIQDEAIRVLPSGGTHWHRVG